MQSTKYDKGVERIGHNAFGEFAKLNSVKFPNTLEKIDAYAFGATPIYYVYLPDSVKYVGARAFVECNNLKKIVIKSKKLKKVGSRAFATIGQNAVIFVPKERAWDYRKMLEDSTAHAQIVI